MAGIFGKDFDGMIATIKRKRTQERMQDMNYNNYEDWKQAAEDRGLSIENGGDNKMIAHDDGDEKGWWNPNYNGGFGTLDA